MYILSLLKEKTVALHIYIFFYVTAALKKETQQPIF